MLDPFVVLRERLLHGGVRPTTVRRYISELKEHLDDLTSEIETEGVPSNEARQRARTRLGSDDVLAQAMICDRRFHSWAARMPWVVFLVAPAIGYGVAVTLLVLALASVVSPDDTPGWFGAAGRIAENFLSFVLPLIAAWSLVFTALRQRSKPLWPLLGIVLTLLIATMTQLQVRPPDVAAAGEIKVTLTDPSVARFVVLLLAVAAPLFFRRWFNLGRVEVGK